MASKRFYTGSCHCGTIKYLIHAELPPRASSSTALDLVRAYKCNCSVCHKSAILHLRLPDAPRDFMLLAPLDPLRAASSTLAPLSPLVAALAPYERCAPLTDYRCNERRTSWLFCRTCGVRAFAVRGAGEVRVRTDVPGREGQNVKVWGVGRRKGAGRGVAGTAATATTATGDEEQQKEEEVVYDWFEMKTRTDGQRVDYLSINAHTLDQPQDGLDLREWHEQGRIEYLDQLEQIEDSGCRVPCRGGTY